MVQAACANPIGALFVFLYLLEGYAERIGKRRLAHIEHEPAHADTTADVFIDVPNVGVGCFFHVRAAAKELRVI